MIAAKSTVSRLVMINANRREIDPSRHEQLMGIFIVNDQTSPNRPNTSC